MLGSQVTVTGPCAKALGCVSAPPALGCVALDRSLRLSGLRPPKEESEPSARCPGHPRPLAQILRSSELPEARLLLLCPHPTPTPHHPASLGGLGQWEDSKAGAVCGPLAPQLPGQAGQAPQGVDMPVPAVGLPSTPSRHPPAPCRPCRLPFLQGGPGPRPSCHTG